MPGYVADYMKEQEHDEASEREHFERETESIPAWMDEEKITAREYEGEDPDYWTERTEEEYVTPAWQERDDLVDSYARTRYAETPEDIDERIKAYQENYGATAEERVEAYQEEAREAERESAFRMRAF